MITEGQTTMELILGVNAFMEMHDFTSTVSCIIANVSRTAIDRDTPHLPSIFGSFTKGEITPQASIIVLYSEMSVDSPSLCVSFLAHANMNPSHFQTFNMHSCSGPYEQLSSSI